MIYCVVPRPLADELYPRLSAYYENDEGVTVIIDRRQFDRRARGARSRGGAPDGSDKRVVRDRRRARIAGDQLPLARASA
jgi:hypothetical protein